MRPLTRIFLRLILGAACTGLPLRAQPVYTNGQVDPNPYTTTLAYGLTLHMDSGSATQSGVIDGTGAIRKLGNGSLILSAINTYAGITIITEGAIVLAGHNRIPATDGIYLADTGAFDLGGYSQTVTRLLGPDGTLRNGTLTINQAASENFSGVISNATLVFNGAIGSRFTLDGSADNPFGILRVNGGSVTLAKNSPTAHAVGNNGVALTINSGSAVSLGGTGGDQIYTHSDVILNAGGTFNLSGRNEGFNTLTGSGTVINTAPGTTATLTLGENNGTATFDGTLNYQSPNTAVALVKVGTGTLTLSGDNTHTGGTTISGGTLALGASHRLSDQGPVTIAGGILALGAFNETILDLTFSSGSLTGTGTLTAGYFAFANAGDLTISSPLAGGALGKTGGGNLTLASATSLPDGTTITQGTLTLGASERLADTGAVTIAGGTLALGAHSETVGAFSLSSGALTGTGPLTATSFAFSNGSAVTLSTPLAGSGALTKSGAGSLRLSVDNSYTGGTTIFAGTVYVGSMGAIPGNIVNHGSLVFDRSGSFTHTGDISGTGAMTFLGYGADVLTLSGNNAFPAGTTLTAAPTATPVLLLNSANALGSSGSIALDGVTLRFSANNRADYSSRFSTAAGQKYLFDTNGQSVTFGTALTSSGGLLTKSGPGTLTLTRDNTYAGVTTISAGTLQLGDGHTAGSVASGSIVNGGALVFNRSDALSYAGDISGTGTFTKLGNGELTLSGANSYTGRTVIGAGTVIFDNALALPAGRTMDNFVVNAGATAAFGLGGAGRFSATEVIALTQLGSATGGFASGSFLGLHVGSSAFILSGSIGNPNGGARVLGLVKLGAGTLTLTGDNTYSGGTVVSAGTLQLGGPGAFGSSSSPFAVNAGGTLDLNGRDLSLASLGGTGGEILNLAVNTQATLTLASGNFAGGIRDGGGTTALVKTGPGTLTLSGDTSHSGATTINAGTLVAAGSSLVNNSLTFNGGTLSVPATSNEYAAYGGGITVNAGGGTLEINNVKTTLYGVTAGEGPLIKSGPGTLQLFGAINYHRGPTIINGGTLVFTYDDSGDFNFPATESITVNHGGTLLLENYNSFGDFPRTTLVINAGGLVTNGPSSFSPGGYTTLRDLTLNGGELRANLGYSAAFPSYQLTGTVTVGGTGPSRITKSNAGLHTGIQLGDNTGGSVTTFHVADVTNSSAADLIVSANLENGRNGIFSGLTKTGAGTLELSGANTYSGPTTISAGTLLFVDPAALEVTVHNLVVQAGATAAFKINYVGESPIEILLASSSATRGFMSGSYVGIDVDEFDVATSYTDYRNPNGGANTLGLVKSGPGTLVLQGNSTYTGNTIINDGWVSFSYDVLGSFYNGSTSAASIVVNRGGTLAVNRTDLLGTWLANSPLALTINAGGLVVNSDSLFFGTGFNTFNNLTLNGGELRSVHGANGAFPSYQLKGTVTVGGTEPSRITKSNGGLFTGIQLGDNTAGGLTTFAVADVTNSTTADLSISTGLENGRNNVGALVPSGLVKTGAGTLLLSSTNIYTGSTIVSAGTLQLGDSGTVLADSGAVVVNGGIFALGAANETVGSLAGSGGIVQLFNGSGRTLTVGGNNSSTTFAGSIQGAGGSLIKNGTGSLTLSGVNLFTGATTVSDGTLMVNGSLANTPVAVAAGATLGGSGTIGGLTTLAGGAHLAPGNSPGTLTFTNGLTLATGVILDFQLGTTSDRIVVTGGTLVSEGGVILNLTDAGGFGAGIYTLFDFSTGTTNATAFDAADFSLAMSPTGFTYGLALIGNTLQLTASVSAIPEPATYAMIAGVAMLALAGWRRRNNVV